MRIIKIETGISYPIGTCSRCGYISSNELCKACLLLEGLERGIPGLAMVSVCVGLHPYIQELKMVDGVLLSIEGRRARKVWRWGWRCGGRGCGRECDEGDYAHNTDVQDARCQHQHQREHPHERHRSDRNHIPSPSASTSTINTPYASTMRSSTRNTLPRHPPLKLLAQPITLLNEPIRDILNTVRVVSLTRLRDDPAPA